MLGRTRQLVRFTGNRRTRRPLSFRPRMETLEDRRTPTAAPLDITSGMTLSPEYLSGVVSTAYQRFLGRQPDPAGLAISVDQLANGMRDEQLEAVLISSPEYVQNHGGPGASWVAGVYQDLLGRQPDPVGLQVWTDDLAAGSPPEQIALALASGPEREAARVIGNYQKFLGRNPDQSEVANGLNLFANGLTNEQMAAAFAASPEDQAIHLNDVGTWVAGAYKDLLGRFPGGDEIDALAQAITGVAATDGPAWGYNPTPLPVASESMDALGHLWGVISLTKNADQAPWLSDQFGQGEDASDLAAEPTPGSAGTAAVSWADILAARPLIQDAVILFDEARHASGDQETALVDQGNQLLAEAGQLVLVAQDIWSNLWGDAIQPNHTEAPPQSASWNPIDWFIPPAYASEPTPPGTTPLLGQQLLDWVKKQYGGPSVPYAGQTTCSTLFQKAFTEVGAANANANADGTWTPGTLVGTVTQNNTSALSSAQPGDLIYYGPNTAVHWFTFGTVQTAQGPQLVTYDHWYTAGPQGHWAMLEKTDPDGQLELLEQNSPTKFVTKEMVNFNQGIIGGSVQIFRAIPQ
jgi:hypothetical protein